MSDNRKKKAIDYYTWKPYEASCNNCQKTGVLAKIKDGYDTLLCNDCLELTLEELSHKDDFYK